MSNLRDDAQHTSPISQDRAMAIKVHVRRPGSLLLFTDASLTPKLSKECRLAWREMGDSVTTAKRALQIGRFQLQRLQLNTEHAASSADLSHRVDRLDSTAQSAYMTLAKFFLLHAAARELDITNLLAEVDKEEYDAPSAVESGSASAVSVSDVSASMMQAPAQLRMAHDSYAPDVPSMRPAQSSLTVRSNSFGSAV